MRPSLEKTITFHDAPLTAAERQALRRPGVDPPSRLVAEVADGVLRVVIGQQRRPEGIVTHVSASVSRSLDALTHRAPTDAEVWAMVGRFPLLRLREDRSDRGTPHVRHWYSLPQPPEVPAPVASSEAAISHG